MSEMYGRTLLNASKAWGLFENTEQDMVVKVNSRVFFIQQCLDVSFSAEPGP